MQKKAAKQTKSKPTKSRKLKHSRSSSTSIKDQVYDRIRLDIISFELMPGERISETQLAERLGVGLASVRAVLPRLVQEGLVENKSRLGHVISPITMQEIKNVCQLREILEPEAAELACKHIDLDSLIEIDERSKIGVNPNDRDAEIKSLMANREFHIAIAAATGNAQLKNWVSQLQDFSIRFQYLIRHTEDLSEDWEHSHEPIIEAFRARDGKKARIEMSEHLRSGRLLLIQSILELPNIQDINIGAATDPILIAS